MNVIKKSKAKSKRVKDIVAQKPVSKKTPGKKAVEYLYTLDRNVKHNGKKYKKGDRFKKADLPYDVFKKFLY